MRSSVLTHKRARAFRRALTPPEARVWVRLKGLPEGWPRWRRQHPVGPYVLDFYCAAAGLCLEIDGAAHGTPEAAAHDARRDRWLADRGVHVSRIPAGDVLRDPDEALRSVWPVVWERLGRSPPG